MFAIAVLLALQAVPPPPVGYLVDTPPLGPRPYTLVITDGQVVTRIDYSSGAACAKARDAVLLQWRAQHPEVVTANQSAVCVPR